MPERQLRAMEAAVEHVMSYLAGESRALFRGRYITPGTYIVGIAFRTTEGALLFQQDVPVRVTITETSAVNVWAPDWSYYEREEGERDEDRNDADDAGHP